MKLYEKGCLEARAVDGQVKDLFESWKEQLALNVYIDVEKSKTTLRLEMAVVTEYFQGLSNYQELGSSSSCISLRVYTRTINLPR